MSCSCRAPGGRDGYDISIREENGETYMTAGATLYLAQEDAPELFTGSAGPTAPSQPDGYARWYRIGEDAAWTAMSVQVEGEGGFWVYNPRVSHHLLCSVGRHQGPPGRGRTGGICRRRRQPVPSLLYPLKCKKTRHVKRASFFYRSECAQDWGV